MGSVLVIGQMRKQTTLSTLFFTTIYKFQQESIPVGRVLPAFVVPGGGGMVPEGRYDPGGYSPGGYGPGGAWSPTLPPSRED